VVVVPASETSAFLHPLPVEELWGVGDKTAEQLHRLGLRTVADIAHTPLVTLQRAIGLAAGTQFHRLSWGEDPGS
jgi:DNA polymerase-4